MLGGDCVVVFPCLYAAPILCVLVVYFPGR